MTREEFWEQTHQKMNDKLNEVLPIINEDSPNFIECTSAHGESPSVH